MYVCYLFELALYKPMRQQKRTSACVSDTTTKVPNLGYHVRFLHFQQVKQHIINQTPLYFNQVYIKRRGTARNTEFLPINASFDYV